MPTKDLSPSWRSFATPMGVSQRQQLLLLGMLLLFGSMAHFIILRRTVQVAVGQVQTNVLTEVRASLAQIEQRFSQVTAGASVGPGVASAAAKADSNIVVPGSLYLGGNTVSCFAEEMQVWFMLDSRDVGITPHLCRGKGWEPMITSVFRQTVKEGWHVLDAGANFGWYSTLLSRLVGENGQVVSIEANPRTHQLLSNTVELAGMGRHVQVLHKALFDKDGLSVSISTNPTRSLNNNIRLGAGSASKETAEVTTITLDTVFKELKWPKVDFIKIDVEGVEDMVWQGMDYILENNPNVIIFMEVNPGRTRFQKKNPKEFYQRIHARFPIIRHIDEVRGVVEISLDEMLDPSVDGDLFLYLKK